jgi:sugar lactone lactonase YvrE
LADGRRIVSDTRNHRILLVERSGAATRIGPEETELSDPMFADLSLCGNLLVCDSGNSRVIELEEGQRPVWQFGSTLRSKRYFSFPRSVELAGPARYLVADTANDRIVEASSNTCPQSLDCREAGLFWPRCVRRSPSGTLVIADGRRGRIIELRQEGHILRQLEAIQSGGGKAFVDPHDVRLLPGDHLLVTDSPNGLVVECDWEGKPYRVIGDRDAISLDDPHSAQKLDDGRIAICDSGNHRILVVGAQGQTIESIETIRGDDAICKLNLPRYAEVSDDGTLLIVDTGNNRVLATDLEGQLRWVISEVGGSPIAQLHQPRWATLVGPNEVVIADHFHHRVIHVRRAD